jgi:hypothetical protein
VSAASPHVFTIPPHRAFADALAAGLIARYGTEKTGLAKGLILVPNNRAARAISDAFVRRSDGGLLLPRLVPSAIRSSMSGSAAPWSRWTEPSRSRRRSSPRKG